MCSLLVVMSKTCETFQNNVMMLVTNLTWHIVWCRHLVFAGGWNRDAASSSRGLPCNIRWSARRHLCM